MIPFASNQMEAWNEKVRQLKDESEYPYQTRESANDVYQTLKRLRIKEKGKFRQRMGGEFDLWFANLSAKYSSELMSELVGDDDFWNLTLKLTQNI